MLGFSEANIKLNSSIFGIITSRREVMNMTTRNQISKSFSSRLFVKLGYGDMFDLGTRSLYFSTEGMLIDEASEVVKVVRGYNNFNGQELSEALRKIAALWPSSHQQVMFSFGREGSPVLHIHFPYWKSTSKRFENREELIKQSLNILRKCEPDELNDTENIRGYRAWWD